MRTFKKRAEYQRVRNGRKWVTPAFILQGLVRPDDGGEEPRFGFTVSSKTVAKDAAPPPSSGTKAVRAGAPRSSSPKGDSATKERSSSPEGGSALRTRGSAQKTRGSAPKKRGMAVDRNYARRRLKEAVRLTFEVHAKPGFDYAVIGRTAALTRDFAAMLADMETAFRKLHQDAPPKPSNPAQIPPRTKT